MSNVRIVGGECHNEWWRNEISAENKQHEEGTWMFLNNNNNNRNNNNNNNNDNDNNNSNVRDDDGDGNDNAQYHNLTKFEIRGSAIEVDKLSYPLRGREE